ncbi:MAG: CDP-diacylglycerol--glycerol-3-phosphate 3-phosphatidyltransferase [Christensenellaceae bacterium]
MNLPNKLSIFRMILIPVFVVLFYCNFRYHYLIATAVFVISAFTDFLDGYIARKYNLVTDLGKFLDSSADKVLVLSAFVILSSVQCGIPGWLLGASVSIILARELMVSCLRMIAASKGVVMAADKFGKIKTTVQDFTIIAILVFYEFSSTQAYTALKVISIVMLVLSVVLTVGSGCNYFIKNKNALSQIEK